MRADSPSINESPEPMGTGVSSRLRLAPEQRQMALVLGLAFFLYYTLGTVLQLQSFRLGLIISQLLFIAGPVAIAMRWFYLDRRTVLPLTRPPLVALTATTLGIVGLNYLLGLASILQERVFPTPEGIRRFFERELVYRGPGDFAFVLVAFAVVPAVCEETLFRGFLQSGLVRAFESGPAGVVATALVFAVFHLDPWRFTGVLVLGLFLGWLARRTGNLTLPILAHALNNALSVADTAFARSSPETTGSLWMALGACAIVAISIALLARGGV